MLALLIFILVTLFGILINSIITPFPMSDNGMVRYNTVPWMTGTLIVVNACIYVFWQSVDVFTYFNATTEFEANSALFNLYEKTWTYGFREVYLTDGTSIGGFTSFTSMFMHSNFSHLIGNMIYLWAFGRRIEDACGPWRFLLFYVFAGMVATMGYAVLTSPTYDIPSVGASGAIAGILGAYLILFPGAKLRCLWMPAVVLRAIGWLFGSIIGERVKWKWTVQLPAIIVLALFVVDNLLPTLTAVGEGELAGGVNTVAHMTGFLSALLIFLFVRKDLLRRYLAGRSL